MKLRSSYNAFKPFCNSKRFGFLLTGATDKNRTPTHVGVFVFGRTKMNHIHFWADENKNRPLAGFCYFKMTPERTAKLISYGLQIKEEIPTEWWGFLFLVGQKRAGSFLNE